jgi:hypothetical protein
VDLESAVTLRASGDVVRLTFPGEGGTVFVLQVGDADQNVLVREGGEFVFALLELCDGTRRWAEIRQILQTKFNGPESFWTTGLPEAARSLLAWRIIEAVEQ